MSGKRRLDDEEAASLSNDVYISESIHDRKSTFIGYYAPYESPEVLQARAELKSATHRVAAWRTPSKQTTLKSSASLSQQRAYNAAHDDDGEQWAGKRVEKVLEDLDVVGTVVVARWYGGIMLGPVRFTHIENVAKGAIRKWRDRGGAAPPTSKRSRAKANGEGTTSAQITTAMQPEDVERKRASIISELEQRDHSIIVLRALLDQKRAKVAEYLGRTSHSSPNRQTISPSKQADYNAMALMRLQALDKARDASIEFLLKEINKAEEEEKRLAAEDAAGEHAVDEAFEKFEQHTTVNRANDPQSVALGKLDAG